MNFLPFSALLVGLAFFAWSAGSSRTRRRAGESSQAGRIARIVLAILGAIAIVTVGMSSVRSTDVARAPAASQDLTVSVPTRPGPPPRKNRTGDTCTA